METSNLAPLDRSLDLETTTFRRASFLLTRVSNWAAVLLEQPLLDPPLNFVPTKLVAASPDVDPMTSAEV